MTFILNFLEQWIFNSHKENQIFIKIYQVIRVEEVQIIKDHPTSPEKILIQVFKKILQSAQVSFQYYRKNKNKLENQNSHTQNQQARIRSLNQRNIHQCSCDKQCNQQHCICFLYTNQLCVIGLCCPTCVKIKNSYLNRDHSERNNNLGCYCKNIKCLKMYCSCYREGKKCSKTICKCQGCQNDTQNLIDKKKKKSINMKQIERKKAQLQKQRENYHLFQNPNNNKMVIDTKNYQFTNCSCKKSHCLKKYCTCFLSNKPCNQTCICQDCYNKFQQDQYQSKSQREARIARYGRYGHQLDDHHHDIQDSNNIDQYLNQQENYQNQELNQNMEFEPVNFEYAGK